MSPSGRPLDERDPLVAQAHEMVEPGPDAGVVVDVDRRHPQRARALPQPDDGYERIGEVRDQPRLVLEVAEQDDRVAVARLEDRGQGEGLVGAAAGVAEDEVVAVAHRRDRQRLDRAREERVGDVADDGAEQHRRCAAEAAGEGIRPVAQPAGGGRHALPRLRRDRDARGDVVQDARDRALRHPGRDGDVAHRRDRPGPLRGRRLGLVDDLGLRLADVLDSHPRSLAFVAVIRLRAFASGDGPEHEFL